MAFCTNCGGEIRANARYCPECSAALQGHEPERELETDEIRCPRCGSPMVVRKARKGPNAGKRFYVCENYPECKGKIPMEESKSSTSKVVTVLAIVFMVVVIATCIWILLAVGGVIGTSGGGTAGCFAQCSSTCSPTSMTCCYQCETECLSKCGSPIDTGYYECSLDCADQALDCVNNCLSK